MKAIHDAINSFQPISLKEMDSIKLMERVDTKYAFKIDLLPEILSNLSGKYRVLEVSEKRLTTYESLYYDSPSFELYYKHHQGKSNRYKVRFRKYVESDLSFFEIKYKSNKDRTIKKRIKQSNISLSLEPEAVAFLKQHSDLSASLIEAKMYVYYKRLTLVNNNLTERVTIDLDLGYARLSSESITYDNLAIVEIKQDKAGKSDMAMLLKKKHLREGTVSKYCLGVASLFDNVRSNNFKEGINKFKKLQYGVVTGS